MLDEGLVSKNRAIAKLAIETIRTLSMDAVQKANSGHPGTPMAQAPFVYTLWQDFLRFNPADPIWPNRDRFVLSCGHASMVLYSVLFLSGTKAVNADYEVLGGPSVSLEDIKRFRQIGSKCPGHPEYHLVSGVEATTGPLGQGIGNSVGMAIAERWLESHFNRPGFKIFDYNIYALCSDGDLMEGISEEVASLAGHLALSNLCWIYDNNRVSLSGPTDVCFSEDVKSRFISYGWNVTRVGDANDIDLIKRSIRSFHETSDRPTLIILDSHIGYGSPHKHDSYKAHGSPLGEDEVRLAKRFYHWPEDQEFLVPPEVVSHFQSGLGKRGRRLQDSWKETFSRYQAQFPDLALQIQQMQNRELPKDWDADLPVFPSDPEGKATRETSGALLNIVAQKVPWLLGGSADLDPSTKTHLEFEGAGEFEQGSYSGRNIHFGVREHGMGAVVNGLALSKIRPFGATFLIFSDYQRPAIRLSALMEIPAIHIFTHDSIGLGEDGPTHQPIGELVSLRAIPGLIVLRPADANEVTEAWRVIMPLKHEPVALLLTRQAVPTIDRTRFAPATGVSKGAYVLADSGDSVPEVILMATGSEVHICLQAFEKLTAEGFRVRVVSMPSWELFEQQTKEYRDQVLPPQVTARVSVEQASTLGWDRYVGPHGIAIGMKTFGASAPLKDLLAFFGFTVENVIDAVRLQLEKGPR